MSLSAQRCGRIDPHLGGRCWHSFGVIRACVRSDAKRSSTPPPARVYAVTLVPSAVGIESGRRAGNRIWYRHTLQAATDSHQLDARGYVRVLWRRKWLFLAIAIAVPAATYAVTTRIHKTYQASILMQVQAPAVDTTLFNSQASVPTDQSVEIASRLIETTGVAQAAAQQLSPPRPSAGALLGALTLNPDPTTGFITITASAGTPQRAADIANAFGSAITTTRTQEAVNLVNQAISRALAQLNALPKNAVIARRQLSGQVQRLRALRAAQGSNAQIIEPAVPPSAPSSPRPVRATALGLVIGLLLAFLAVALAEMLDRRVRSADDLEELTGLPVLATVPRAAFRGVETFASAEAFRNLRTSLTYFNIDRKLDCVAIASPSQGDGKTLVALELAKACARAGLDVVLVDADLRSPDLAKRLDIEPSGGLVDVLVGHSLGSETLSEINVGAIGEGRLRVLPTGKTPPNPSELLASERMRSVLDQLIEQCDIVIVDTSPLLPVRDALPLVERASGAVLVVRLGETSRDAIHEVQRIITAAHGSTLGVVATGGPDSSPYQYGAYRSQPVVDEDPKGESAANGHAEGGRVLSAFGRLRR